MDKADVAVCLATIGVVGSALLVSAERLHKGPMTFIERHLGFSPDNGGGSIEILVAVAIVGTVIAATFRWATK